MMDRYKITFETWDKLAELYQEKFMDLDKYNDSYELFCSLVKKGEPPVLEIGCGPGNITRYLLQTRPDFNIMAIDVAPNMIELAAKNNPGANFKVMDCRDVSSLHENFDGIICGFCIPYLSMEDCTRLIADCAHLLNKDGILYLSSIKGDHERSGFESGSTGDRAYVYYYDEDFFKKELLKNNFNIVNFIEKEFPKSDGTIQIHQILIVQKSNKR